MKNQFLCVLGTPTAAQLAELGKLMIVNEWSVRFELFGFNVDTVKWQNYIQFRGAVLPRLDYTKVALADFSAQAKDLRGGAHSYVGMIELEGAPSIDGDGIVGFARTGDTVILTSDTAGYSTDLASVYEIPFLNASGAMWYLVIGVAEVPQTDFYTPYQQANVKAVAYLEGNAVETLRVVSGAIAQAQTRTVQSSRRVRSNELKASTSQTKMLN